ncbi:MAG TPA: sialidase family protein [Thermoanaerobaculia bacterium]|jgi:hypothetical protein|nr:sialidase family protein [Thermoanaerobaculia bacterium]
MKRLTPPFVLLILATLIVLFVALAGWATEPPSFSRSRWLDEQKAWGARFPEGLPPAKAERIKAFLDSLPVAAPKARAAAGRAVRISQDILEPNGSAAQPETQAEPFIALDPERETHLLAGFQESRFANGGARALAYAVSTDGGKSWNEGLIPGLTFATGGRFERASDPWVAFGPGGRAYYASIAFHERAPDNAVMVSASDDGGQTWGPPVAVRSEAIDFCDKEAVVVDTRADSPFFGRVYVGWDTVVANQRQPALISHSDNGGASFTTQVTIHDRGSNLGVFPVVAPGGVVHAFWARYTFSGNRLLTVDLQTARSTDGGDTWSPAATVSKLLTAGVFGLRTGENLPSAAVDPRNGDLYVVWQDQRFSPGVDQIVLAKSTDGGETWSGPRLVSDGPKTAAAFTPAVAVNANGLVGVAYYSLRNDPSRRVLVDEYLAVSRDRGQRFGRSVRVSTTSWDVRSAAFAEGFFLGDYQGLAASRVMFHPLWIATLDASRLEPGVRQPDAFTRGIKAR